MSYLWVPCPRCGKDIYNSYQGWRDHDERCELSPVIEGHAVLVDAINRLGAVIIRDLFIEPGYAQKVLDRNAVTTPVATLPNADPPSDP